MRFNFFILCILFFLHLIHAEDGLKVVSVPLKEDSTIIKEYLDLHSYYKRTGNRPKHIEMLNKAYAKSLKIKNLRFMAECEEKYAYLYGADYSNSLIGMNYCISAINNYKKLNQESSYHRIAWLYIYLTRFLLHNNDVKSMQMSADSAIFYTNKIRDDKNKLISLLNIVRYFYSIKTQDGGIEEAYLAEAKEYLVAINKLYPKVKDPILSNVSIRLNEMLLNFEKKYIEAFEYNSISLKYSISVADSEAIMYDYLRRGQLLQDLKNYNKATATYQNALKVTTEYRHLHYELIFLYEFAKTYYSLKMYDLAYQNSLKSMVISKKTYSYADIMKNSRLLYKLDSVSNNTKSELSNLRQYYRIRDSLNSLTHSNKSISLIQHFELAKLKTNYKELKLENLSKDKEIKNDNFKIIYLSIASLLFLGMSIFMFFFYRKYAKQSMELTIQKNLITKQVLELEQQNKTLERINQEKNDLIGIVSHDLKAPLNRAQALIDLIVNDSTSDLNTEQDKLFARLKSEIMDEKAMISEILNAELNEMELKALNSTKTEINKSIEEFIQSFKPLAHTKDIKLTYKPFVKDVYILANLTYLRRAFDNLLSNAIKFSNSEKTITILIDNVDDDVFLHIIDEGQGFSEEDQKNLFKKYRKLSSKPTAGEASTGLGLSIVKNLVEAMNGSISLISKKNQGSTFTLKFKAIKNE